MAAVGLSGKILALTVALALAAALPSPASAQATCTVQGTLSDNSSSSHYDATAGMDVLLTISNGGGKMVIIGPVSSTASGSGATYQFAGITADADGIEAGDTLTVSTTGHGHTLRVSGTATGGCAGIITMGAAIWINDVPTPVPQISPLGALDDDNLIDATPTPVDPNGDNVVLTRIWGVQRGASTECAYDPGLTGTSVSASLTQMDDIWCLQVTARDTDHQSPGQGTSAVVVRRIGNLDDIPVATFSMNIGGSAFLAGQKVVPGVGIEFSATGTADGVGGTPTDPADLTLRWDFDGDGAFGSDGTFADNDVVTYAYATSQRGANVPALQAEDLEGFVGQASKAIWVNRLPDATLGSLGSPSRTTGASATVALSDTDNLDASGQSPDDVLSYDFQWLSAATCAGPFSEIATASGTSSSTSQSLPGSLTPTRGNCLRLEVTPKDGLESGTVATVDALVANSAPGLTGLVITPPNPTASSTLVAAFTPSDLDTGDSLTCDVDWYQSTDGTPAGLPATPTEDGEPYTCAGAQSRELPGSHTLVNDHLWRVHVSVTDPTLAEATAEDDTLIGNTAPILGGLALAGSPTRADSITPTISDADDADGLQATFDPDTGQTIQCTWRWFKVSGATETPLHPTSGPGTGDCDAAAMALPSGIAAYEDVVRLRATPNDGTSDGDERASNAIEIANALPTATASITTLAPKTGDDLTVQYQGFDADPGQTIFCTIGWHRNSQQPAVREVAGVPCNTEQEDTLPASFTKKGETWDVVVLPIDSEGGAQGASGSNLVTILDTPPTASAGPDKSVTEGLGVALAGSASDPDVTDGIDSFTFAWTQVSPASPSVTLANSATPTFSGPSINVNPSVVFTERLTVTASHPTFGGASAAPDDVAITVNNINTNPSVNAGPDQNVGENAFVTLAGSASDAEPGDPLSFTWTAPAGVTLSSTTSASPTFTAPTRETTAGGAYTFTLQVTDGFGGSGQDTVIIHVAHTNRAPSLAGVSILPVAPEAGQALTATPTGATDPDGDTVTCRYVWTPVGSATGSRDVSGQPCSGDSFTPPAATAGDSWTVSVTPRDVFTLDGASVGATSAPMLPLDMDDDGEPDETDNCDAVANPGQDDQDADDVGDACDPDRDGDGTPDTVDGCGGNMATNPAEQADRDCDGIGDNADLDGDNDGDPDTNDNCPVTANSDQADLDQDGIGNVCDPDRDGDGIPNGQDPFPDQFGTPTTTPTPTSGPGPPAPPASGGDGSGGVFSNQIRIIDVQGRDVGSLDALRGVVTLLSSFANDGTRWVAVPPSGEAFFLDVAKSVGVSTQSSHDRVLWDTTRGPNGAYTLQVRDAGQVVLASRAVIVDNPTASVGDVTTGVVAGVATIAVVAAAGPSLTAAFGAAAQSAASNVAEDRLRTRLGGKSNVWKRGFLRSLVIAIGAIFVLALAFSTENLASWDVQQYLHDLQIIGVATAIVFAVAYALEVWINRRAGLDARMRFLPSGFAGLVISTIAVRLPFGYPAYVQERTKEGRPHLPTPWDALRNVAIVLAPLFLLIPLLLLRPYYYETMDKAMEILAVEVMVASLPVAPLPGGGVWEHRKSWTAVLVTMTTALFVGLRLGNPPGILLVGLAIFGVLAFLFAEITLRWWVKGTHQGMVRFMTTALDATWPWPLHRPSAAFSRGIDKVTGAINRAIGRFALLLVSAFRPRRAKPPQRPPPGSSGGRPNQGRAASPSGVPGGAAARSSPSQSPSSAPTQPPAAQRV